MQATAQVIPFNFETREVRTLLIDDQPWFVAADVCESLAIANTARAMSRLDDDEKGVHSVNTLGGTQNVSILNESGLYSLILTSRKAEAKRFKKWVTAEVLPAIRKHGRYEDASGQMRTLIGQTIGTDGFHCLAAVLDGKVRHLPVAARRGAKNHIWSQVHKAFSVVTAEDIPAAQLDSARNFIAAYHVQEGEWIAKEKPGGTLLTDMQLYDVYFVCSHFKALCDIFNNYKLYSHFSGIGSPVGAQMIDHVRDGFMGYHKLQELAPEFVAVQKRLRLNEYRTA
ncbi:BRO-N domain-containing protein [Stutzerimonas nitrititolerans]|uniref:Bro-N domain-containing protein n=1 Tax=Stutzerimonas nitrititolerans TaxID=2482751 RepID=A0AA41WPF2_9GAMM|nr:Bro-N domain-containing protein [Stutzerimonas nitrititolerans]MCO7546180.1 Bro-N domain-containing protein [Stutzerimonas nitrititolerans]